MITRFWRTFVRIRNGSAMVHALIASAIMAGVGLSVVSRSTAHVRQMQQSAEQDQSWYLAMAGIEECMASLRWGGITWSSFSSTTCSGTLNGGSYSATAAKVSVITGLITSTGTYGRFTRTLVANVQWNENQDPPGSMSLYGGGNWRFSGNANIEGNIATTGNIEFAGSAQLCGQAYAKGTVSPPLPTLTNYYKPGCSSTAVGGVDIVQAYTDSLVHDSERCDPTYATGCGPGSGKNASPSTEYTLTCPGDCDNDDLAIRVYGTVVVPNKGITFTKTKKIIADGFIVNGAVQATSGNWTFFYTMATHGGSQPCNFGNGTPNSNDVGSTIAMWVSQTTHRDIVIWVPNGGVYFAGSQAGGGAAGVYGRVYGACVQTSDNWNFFPGSDMPGGDCNVGCASTLRLTTLYEP